MSARCRTPSLGSTGSYRFGFGEEGLSEDDHKDLEITGEFDSKSLTQAAYVHIQENATSSLLWTSLGPAPDLPSGAAEEIPQKLKDSLYDREKEIQKAAQAMKRESPRGAGVSPTVSVRPLDGSSPQFCACVAENEWTPTLPRNFLGLWPVRG